MSDYKQTLSKIATAVICKLPLEIRLHNRNISYDQRLAIINILRTAAISVLHLNYFYTCDYDYNIKELVCLFTNPCLLTLNLVDNYIGNESAEAIAAALPGSTITNLSLRSNNIGSKGARAIAAALPGSSVIRLDLKHNKITDKGAEAIAAALPYSLLTKLDLGWNKIGGAGIGAIANALALPNSTLISLCVACNKIEDEMMQEIINALLSASSNLLRLDLQTNEIKNLVAGDIARLLINSPLTKLNLSNNKIEYEGIKLIIDAARNSHLDTLYLYANFVYDFNLVEIIEGINNTFVTKFNFIYENDWHSGGLFYDILTANKAKIAERRFKRTKVAPP